ncbi:MAG: hypothetical protein HC919_11050, partial [Oscillatoriales cyanobacterium SM2_2_1]|nr:hypothetical protein [Oscillatoriales cyanobacterium SM2_2_1]
EQRLPCPVIPQCLSAPNVPKAIAQAATEQRAQVILLGASREGFYTKLGKAAFLKKLPASAPAPLLFSVRENPKNPRASHQLWL